MFRCDDHVEVGRVAFRVEHLDGERLTAAAPFDEAGIGRAASTCGNPEGWPRGLEQSALCAWEGGEWKRPACAGQPRPGRARAERERVLVMRLSNNMREPRPPLWRAQGGDNRADLARIASASVADLPDRGAGIRHPALLPDFAML